MTQDTLTTFFGWITVLNIGILSIATLSLIAMRDWASDLHVRMFGLEKQDVQNTYFRWLAMYKMLTLIFCVVPYVALKLI